MRHLRVLSVVGAKLGAFVMMLRARAEDAERVRELEEARRTAESANRAKDEFLALVSHELKTPLASTLTWVHVLRSKGIREDERARAIEAIERNVRAEAKLIDDLLDLSCIATAELRLDLRAVEPVRLLKASIEALRPRAEQRLIRLEAALDQWVRSEARSGERPPHRLDQGATDAINPVYHEMKQIGCCPAVRSATLHHSVGSPARRRRVELPLRSFAGSERCSTKHSPHPGAGGSMAQLHSVPQAPGLDDPLGAAGQHNHVVQFYDSDEFLGARVVSFLRVGVRERPCLWRDGRRALAVPAESYPQTGDDDLRLREVSVLQQRAKALETEISHRKEMEAALRKALYDLRTSEEALRRSERELKDFVENAAEGLQWVGPDGIVLWAVAAATPRLPVG